MMAMRAARTGWVWTSGAAGSAQHLDAELGGRGRDPVAGDAA